jgi:hypothetical protein
VVGERVLKETKASRPHGKSEGGGEDGEDARTTRQPETRIEGPSAGSPVRQTQAPGFERQTMASGDFATVDAPAESALGDRYQVVSELGRGAYGIVYRARDRVADEEVAVKLLAPQVAASATAVERFRRELRAARRITHPGVVRIHDLVEVGHRLLLSMELVEGTTLEQRLRDHPRIEAAELTAMALDIARALAAAHRAGVTHRDLKPANIMVRASNGRLVVADFGVSRLAELVDSQEAAATASQGDPGLTNDGTLIGTPLYMAPEQLEGAQDVGPRADVYAFGVVMYELATGKAPHECQQMSELLEKRLHHAAPPLRSLRDDLPDWLTSIVDRCLERDPEKRPPSGIELKDEISAALRRSGRRGLLPILSAALLLVALLGGGAFWWTRGRLPSSDRRLAFRVHNIGGRDDDWIAAAAARMARRRLVMKEERLDATDDAARANVLVDVGYRHDPSGITLDASFGPAVSWARMKPLDPVHAPSVSEAVDRLLVELSGTVAAGQSPRGPNAEERAEMTALGAPSLEAYRQFRTLIVDEYGLVATDWVALQPAAEKLIAANPKWGHAWALAAGAAPEHLEIRDKMLRALPELDAKLDPVGFDLVDAIANPYTQKTMAEMLRDFAQHPSDVLVGWQLSVELRKARRSDENVAVMRKLHQLWPDLQFGGDLATALRTMGRDDEVPGIVDEWLRQAPDNEMAMVQRVQIDASLHRPEAAARHAHDLVLLQGAGPVRLATLCDILMLIDHLGEARQRADELLQSDRMAGWSRKAQLALLEGKFNPAVDALAKVTAMPDTDLSGDMLYALDDLRRVAHRVGNRALELKTAEQLMNMWKEIPARYAVFKYRFEVLRDGKCPPLDRALAAVPQGEAFATARLNIIRAAAANGCASRAEVVRAGMLPDDSDMGSLYEFGVAAEEEGALSLARDALEKVREVHVLSIDSTSSVTPYCEVLARFHLGRVLERMGKKSEARAQYDDFLDHWGHADRGVPEVDEARAAVARL